MVKILQYMNRLFYQVLALFTFVVPEQGSISTARVRKIFSIAFLYLVLIFTVSAIKAQGGPTVLPNATPVNAAHAVVYKTINYGETIKFRKIPDAATFIIHLQNSSEIFTVHGKAINQFVFEKPGTYTITYTENVVHTENKCEHDALPPELTVVVSPAKMTFDFSAIQFSTPLRVGTISGTVSVPVHVELYQHQPISFSLQEVHSAGVAANIVATPVQRPITLQEGTTTLTYNLSGVVELPTYVMLDFVGYNGNIQSYNCPKID